MSVARRPRLAGLLLPALLCSGLAPDEGEDERSAAALLAAAEEQCSKGRYERAVSQYRSLARQYPETRAGKVAAARTQPTAYLGWTDLLRHGPSSNRVDVVVLGDGYTLDQQDAFDDIAKTVPRVFEHDPLLEEYFAYHNFLRANLVSAEAGVDGLGREFDTALGGFIRGTDQGHVGVDVARVQAWLAELPEQDGLAIAYVKRGVLGTGGGGVATVGGRGDATTIHEWGHAFAGLADEYSQDTGHRGVVATRINISDSDDPARVPWKHWLDSRARGIGIYEGGDGRDRGAWKPTNNCLMNTADFFCPVCREAVVLRIHEFVDPIDACTPEAHPFEDEGGLALAADGSATLEVVVLAPKSHALLASWWVLPEEGAPRSSDSVRVPGRSRAERGPLPALLPKPDARTRADHKGRHRYTLTAKDHPPGRYRVVCRVVDDTKIAGDPEPWVLLDPHGLLQSERAWWVEVQPAGG